MLWLHYVVIVCLFVAILAKYISPYIFWLPAFFGLAFPFLFLLNVFLVIFWLIQFKHTIIFGLIALFIALPTAYRYLQFSSPNTKSSSKTLKVTSYNCMLFDLYNWKKSNESRNNIFNSLNDINPSIICFQEFYTSEGKHTPNNIDTLKHLLHAPYYHLAYTTTHRDEDHWGIATFSKYPIINQGKIVFNTSSNNICIYSDVVINKDTLRIYNTHLQSISFTKEDNKFLDEVVSEKNASAEIEHSTNILRYLKRAFIKRAKQVDMIALHIKSCKHKIIICGDFNDTAASYTYQVLSKNLNDAFVEKGSGFGQTYAGKWPQFRIDYILHDKNLKCTNYIRYEETFTDHYPITAYFENI